MTNASGVPVGNPWRWLLSTLLWLLVSCAPASPFPEEPAEPLQSASAPIAAHTQRMSRMARGRGVTLRWSDPGPMSDCPVCSSSNYSCTFQEGWNPVRTFVDPIPPGARAVGVIARLLFRDGHAPADDGSTACFPDLDTGIRVNGRLNALELGGFDLPQARCDCGQCSDHYFERWETNFLPYYTHGGTNTFELDTVAQNLCVQSVGLTIYYELRRLGITPGSISFGDQPIGTPSASQTVELRNVGETELLVGEITAAPPFQVSGLPALPLYLDPDETATFTVTFEPTACGEAEGSVRVESDDMAQPIQTVPLFGRGTNGVVLPSLLDFGSQRVGTSSAPLSATLTNATDSPVTLENLSVSGPFAVSGFTTPLTLAAHESRSFEVTFTPTQRGDLSGGLSFTSTPCDGTYGMAFRGTGAAASASLTPASLSFGDQRVGTPSPPGTVTIKNEGNANLDIASLQLTGPFTVLGFSAPRTLAPNESVTFSVVFEPTAEGLASGSLSLQTNAFSGNTTLALAGRGVSATLMLSANTLSFGNTRVASSASQTVVVQNTGTGPVTLQQVSASEPFQVSGLTPGRVLAPSEFINFQVAFSPQEPGPVSGMLTLVSDASNSPHTAALDGIGTYASMSAAPASVNFGAQQVNTPSPPQTVVLRNSGTATLHLSSFAATPPFSVSGLSPGAVLEPGGSLSFQVSFRPGVFGDVSGSLTLTSDALIPVTVIPLSGTGASATLTASPDALSFGNQPVNTPSPLRTVTLVNTGTATLTIQSVTPDGPYAFSGLELPKTLAPSAGTSFQVSFTPAAAGPVAGTLTFRSVVGSLPDAVVTVLPLSGTGMAPAVTLTPSSVTFATPQRVSTSSPPQTVVLTNSGTASLTLSSSSLFGPFEISNLGSNVTLPAGASLSFRVSFRPEAEGPASGTLYLVTNASNDPFPLRLQGTGIASSLRLDTEQIAFGDQRVGQASTPRQVTVFNDGTAPLHISRVTAQAPFSVSGLSLPVRIPSGGSRTFQVTFRPVSRGQVDDSIVITSDAIEGLLSLPVGGNGVAPELSLSPQQVAFGGQRVGTTGPGLSVTLTNGGTAPLYLAGATVSGPFLVQGLALPRSLGQGESLSFQVAFSPVVRGDAQGTLTFINDTNQPAILPLQGTGTASALVLAPASLSFGEAPIGSSISLPVTLSNPGDAPLHLSSSQLAGPFTTTPLPATLAPGASTSFLVTYSPTAHGFVSGTLTLSSDAAGTPAVQMPLNGTGVGPQVVLSSDQLSFEPINVGTTSPPSELLITNAGERDLRFSAVSFSGDNPEDFSVPAGILPVTLQPGASFPLPFRFKPRAVGARGAWATLFTNASLTPTVRVELLGTGTSPQLTITPRSLSFGGVQAGSTSSPLLLTLTNNGTGPVTLNELSLGGADAAHFTLEPVTPLLTLPITLEPQGSLPLRLTFRPEALRAYEATVSISADDPVLPAVSLPVSGTGTSPLSSLSQQELDFGAQLVGRTARTRTVVLTNNGNVPLTVSQLLLTGPHAEYFQLRSSPSLPLRLEPGASQALEVAFTPVEAMEATGALVITSNDPVSPEARVSLRGLGITSVLSVSPTHMDFGGVAVGQASPPQTITLTNLASVNLSVEHLASSHEAFRIEPEGLESPLAPGQSASFQVIFQPAVEGAVNAEVRIQPRGEGAAELSLSVAGRGRADRIEGNGYSCGSAEGNTPLALLGAILLLSARRFRRSRGQLLPGGHPLRQ